MLQVCTTNWFSELSLYFCSKVQNLTWRYAQWCSCWALQCEPHSHLKATETRAPCWLLHDELPEPASSAKPEWRTHWPPVAAPPAEALAQKRTHGKSSKHTHMHSHCEYKERNTFLPSYYCSIKECAHLCVLVRWQAGWRRCLWWRRWRCCTADREPGLAWRGWTCACPGGLIFDCSAPEDHKWQRTRWSGCVKAPVHPSAAPPRSPPHAAHGDQREATGLGTVATLHV